MNTNRKAWLTMIAVSEGTQNIGDQDGYNVIVGSTPKRPHLFDSYADHPRVVVAIPKLGIKSTAAGRYQVLARYYDAYKKQLKLPDFSPASQDAIALQLIRECKALDDIDQGRIAIAVNKCKSRWASLPGAGYNQPEKTIQSLLAAYQQAGGKLTTA